METPFLKYLNCSQSNGMTTIYRALICLNHFFPGQRQQLSYDLEKEKINEKKRKTTTT